MKKDKITSAAALLLSMLPFAQIPAYAAVEEYQSLEESLEEYSAECEVLYKAPYDFSETIPKDPEGDGVRLSDASGTVEVDGSIAFIVDTGGKPFTADVRDPSIVSININGNVVTVTGIKKGTAVIVVESGGKSAAYRVTVTEKGNGNDTDLLVPSRTVPVGDTIHLVLEKEGLYEVEIADPAIIQAVVENGVVTVTGRKEGTTTITITGNGIRIVYEIVVTPAGNGIQLSETSGIVEVDKTISFTVDTGGNSFTVSVSDPTIANISVNGDIVTVTGGKEGKAFITITSGGKSVTYEVTVTNNKVQTGDEAPLGYAAALFAVSGFGLAIMKKKKDKEENHV